MPAACGDPERWQGRGAPFVRPWRGAASGGPDLNAGPSPVRVRGGNPWSRAQAAHLETAASDLAHNEEGKKGRRGAPSGRPCPQALLPQGAPPPGGGGGGSRAPVARALGRPVNHPAGAGGGRLGAATLCPEALKRSRPETWLGPGPSPRRVPAEPAQPGAAAEEPWARRSFRARCPSHLPTSPFL